MNASLSREFTGHEVREGIDSIGDLKAPGPDGVPAIFYKAFWHMVEPKIQEKVLAVLNAMLNGWSKMTIVMIPKVTNPENVTEF
jgi:hypothetical protein